MPVLQPLTLKQLSHFLRGFLHPPLEPYFYPSIQRVSNERLCICLGFGQIRL